MDPLSALGLAGNILSFIDFSLKLLEATIKIYREADEISHNRWGKKGDKQRNRQAWTKRLLLEDQLNDFIITTSTLAKPQDQDHAPPAPEQHTSSGPAGTSGPPPPVTFELNSDVLDYNLTCLVGYSEFIDKFPGRSSASNDPIEKVATACYGIAQDMLGRLESMKRSGKGKVWTSLKLALQEVWHQESELEDIRKLLSDYQHQLQFNLVVSIRERLDHLTILANRQADQFNTYNTSVWDHLQQLIQEHMVRFPGKTGSDSTITHLSSDVRNEIVDAVKEALQSRDLPHAALDYAILNRSEAVFLGATSLSSNLLSADKRVLESLQDRMLSTRERKVLKAYSDTFDWIFKAEDPDNDHKWDNFTDWLSGHSDSMYWIAGKAGSGKSTLMKYIYENPRTRECLSGWAGSRPLVVASFFFWNTGSQAQRTQKGMLRELIYKVLIEHRELIPVVLPKVKDSDHELGHDVWTFSRLQSIFDQLIRQTLVPLNICFFIDGLDEHEGHDEGIALMVKQIASVDGIKVCVSSRQHRDFERTFRRDPSLRLQDLTLDDIKRYVGGHFNDRQNSYLVASKREYPGLSERLSSNIVRRADGVFLWVRIVVGTLLKDLERGNSGPELEKRLDELPVELEDLYMHMLKNVKDPRIRAEAAQLLQIVQRAEQPFTILQLAFVGRLLESPDVATKADLMQWEKGIQQKMCDDIELKLKSRCLGLIEAAPALSDTFIGVSTRPVQFMHQTVAEFLETPDAREHINESLGTKSFSPYATLMGSTLLVLKHLPTDMLPPRKPYGYLAQTWYSGSWAYINNFAKYARKEAVINMEPNVELVKALDDVAAKLAKILLIHESGSDSPAGKVHWSERTCDENGNRNPCHEDGSMVSFAFKSGLYFYLQASLGMGTVLSRSMKMTSRKAKYALTVGDEEAALTTWDLQPQLRQRVRNELLMVSKRSRLSRKLRSVFNREVDSADGQDILFLA